MAVRDTARGEEAAAAIRAQHPSAQLTVMACDLSSLKSVQQFAADFKKTGKPCHILLANAGVMMCPFTLTADGHEMQFGTNHLGHFALVTALLPVLKATGQKAGEPARVVVLSSAAHFRPYTPKKAGPVRLDNIDSPEGYDPQAAYVSVCGVKEILLRCACTLHRSFGRHGVLECKHSWRMNVCALWPPFLVDFDTALQ
jgi:NAD(P)-dependent dehydrogenase (short-subunit alcohol dehydrogenase family)